MDEKTLNEHEALRAREVGRLAGLEEARELLAAEREMRVGMYHAGMDGHHRDIADCLDRMQARIRALASAKPEASGPDPFKPWGAYPGDAEDPNYGRACICGAPIRAGMRYGHECKPAASPSRAEADPVRAWGERVARAAYDLGYEQGQTKDGDGNDVRRKRVEHALFFAGDPPTVAPSVDRELLEELAVNCWLDAYAPCLPRSEYEARAKAATRRLIDAVLARRK